MITIDFSGRGKRGLCEFLGDSIRAQIMDGLLGPDEKLPSKRSLAAHLGVSVITVQNAYEQLIGEGYIYSIEKKGFFVTEMPEGGKAGRAGKIGKAGRGQKIGGGGEEAVGGEVAGGKKFFFDFHSNTTNVERFPFSQWAHVMRGVLSGGDERLLARQGVGGVFELRAAIARHLQDFRSLLVSPEQIVIGAGTEYLYALLVQFLGQEKTYGVENPGYHKVASVFRLNGARVEPVQIDAQGMIPRLLEQKKIDVAHLSPAHHFPTGIVMPIRRRLELLSWADSAPGRIIIEDDYDSEFRFNGKPLPPLQSLSKNGRVIYINTFSKTIAPSFRISYMILPLPLAEEFQKKLGFYSCPVSAFEQYTLAKFITGGLYETHLIRMKNYYRNLRNSFIHALEKSRLSDLLSIHEEEAGLHFLISFSTKRSGEDLKKAFEAQGLRLPLLKEFYYSDSEYAGQNTFVINYSALQKEKIPRIVGRMEAVFYGSAG